MTRLNNDHTHTHPVQVRCGGDLCTDPRDAYGFEFALHVAGIQKAGEVESRKARKVNALRSESVKHVYLRRPR